MDATSKVTHHAVLYVGPSLLENEILTIKEEALREHQLRKDTIYKNHFHESKITLNNIKEELKNIYEEEKVKQKNEADAMLTKEIEHIKTNNWIITTEAHSTDSKAHSDQMKTFKDTLQNSYETFQLKLKNKVDETIKLQQKITIDKLRKKAIEYGNEIAEIKRKWEDKVTLEKTRVASLEITEREHRLDTAKRELVNIKKVYKKELCRNINMYDMERKRKITLLRNNYDNEKAVTELYTCELKELYTELRHVEDVTSKILDSFKRFIIYSLNITAEKAEQLVLESLPK